MPALLKDLAERSVLLDLGFDLVFIPCAVTYAMFKIAIFCGPMMTLSKASSLMVLRSP